MQLYLILNINNMSNIYNYIKKLSPKEQDYFTDTVQLVAKNCKDNPKIMNLCATYAMGFIVVRLEEEYYQNQLVRTAEAIINKR